MSRKRGCLRSLILKIVLVVVAVYAACTGYSAYMIYTNVNTVTSSYQAYESHVEAGDYQSAANSLRELSTSIGTIKAELDGWQWQVASAVPGVGDDVKCAQKLSVITDSLANDALMPVITRAEALFSEASWNDILGTLGDKATQVAELVEAVVNARGVVGTCRTEVESVPVAHLEELNNLSTELREALVEADDTLSAFDSIGEMFAQ